MPVGCAAYHGRSPALLRRVGAWLLAFGALAASGQTGSNGDPSELGLFSGEDAPALRHFLWVFEDTSSQRDLQAILAESAEFHHVDQQILNPGVSTSVFWMRVRLANLDSRAGTWIFSLDRVLLDTGAIILVNAQGTHYLLSNDPQSFQQSYRQFHTLAGRFSLDPGERAVLYVRYRGANWSGLQPTLQSEESFTQARTLHNVLFLLLLGGVGSLLLIGSVSFLFLGRQIFLLYAVAQLALFAFYAHMTGFTTVYLWPGNAQAGRVFAPLANMMFVVSMAQFARRFFDTPATAPVVNRWLLSVIGIGLVCMVLMPADYLFPGFDRTLPVNVSYGVTLVCWIVLPVLAVRATWQWHLDYWPLAVAWVFMSIFMIGLQLLWTGLSGSMPLGKYIYGVVVYWEAVFQALAIALHIRRLRAEALHAEQRLAASLQAQLTESIRARRLGEEREWALQDLAEKGRLLLAAGHDTRQMLSALRNFAAGLRRTRDPAQIERASRGIEEVADHLNEVLTTAVEGARSGGISDTAIALDRVPLSTILNPAILIHGQSAQSRNLELRVRGSERAIVTDPVLVLRILSNLLSNAVKYTDHGGILLAARVTGARVRLQVWDTGEGIPAELLTRILDTRQAGIRAHYEVDGEGAGLRIAQALAARLGGEIHARSVPGRGSMFELILPHAPARTAGSRLSESANSLRLVLLSRDAKQRVQLEEASRHAGMHLTSCTSVEQVSALLNARASALLLIDHDDLGPEATRTLAELLRANHTPSYRAVLTFDRTADARASIAQYCALILYKPVSPQALLRAHQLVSKPL